MGDAVRVALVTILEILGLGLLGVGLWLIWVPLVPLLGGLSVLWMAYLLDSGGMQPTQDEPR